jgi:CRP/FNR family transcriptional regulator, cyclic AMP receptor protein
MERSQTMESQYSLRGMPFFAGLRSDVLQSIQRQCAWRRYEPGEGIVEYRDTSNDVFFIVEGEVRVTIYSLSGEVVSFTELGAGDVFGEYAAIDGDLRSASVEARSHCLLASMSAAAFMHLLQAQPTVTQALLRKLVRNIRALDRRVYEFSTLAVNYRVQAELLRIANLAPREGTSAHIVPAPTHVEIASRVSACREGVTRELNRLTRIGIIERQRHTLVVKDVDRLAAMVHDATGE